MIYRGIFADINEQVYWVDFITNGSTSGTPVELTLGDTPCVISNQSDGLFDPMKPSTCTIQIVTKEFIPDLYTSDPHGIEVKVIHKSNTDEIKFHGYVTPCMYSSSYTYIDTIEIEAVDALSTLQYYDFTYVNGSTAQNVTLISLIKRACTLAGYTGKVNWIETFNNYSINDDICINEGNFFDDDDEHSPWKWWDVVEEICKFLGWSCVPYGDDIWFTDYRYLANVVQYGNTPWTYKTWTIGSSSNTTNYAYGWKLNWSYDNLPIAPGRTMLSLDEVYNKISISANTYNIDKFIPKIDNVNDHISINKEQNDFDYSAGVSTTSTYKTWFWGKKKEMYSGMPGFWSAYCRLDEDKNWVHHFYNIRNGNEITTGTYKYKYESYSDPRAGALTSAYQNTPANRMINTVCAIPCHYSFDSDNASTVSWSDCLMVLKYNDLSNVGTRGQFKLREDALAEKPLLTYENNDNIIFKPATGTTWITIKSDLFFQRNQRVILSGSNSNYLYVVNSTDHVYATVPFDGEVKVGDQSFDSEPLLGEFNDNNEVVSVAGTSRTSLDSAFKTGFELLPFRVQLGNKWWNGSSWQSTSCIFYVKHTNEPDDDKEETVVTLKWMKIVPNTTYVDKVNESAYAIPIAYNDDNAPSCGTLKIEMMCPRMIPKAWHDLWPNNDARGNAISFNWASTPGSSLGFGPCVYIKGFECNIVYTDTSIWWMDKADSDTDIVYSNKVEDDDYINEYDALELKINTAVEEKPISKSFVSDGNKYIRDMIYVYEGSAKPQEETLIDMYHEHYVNPCKEFTVNARYRVSPYHKFTFGTTISGEFVYDSQTWDVRKAVSEIKFIEYKSDIE